MQKSKAVSQALASYLADIARWQPLSSTEEIVLSGRIQKGDQKARDELVQRNLRFVVKIAKEYCGRGLSYEDLIGAGNIGLFKAAERFDGTKGFKFISYAVWWVRQAIQQALAEDSQTVRLPPRLQHLRNSVQRATDPSISSRLNEAELDTVADIVDQPVSAIRAALLLPQISRSLDETVGSAEERRLYDILPDTDQVSPEEEMMEAEKNIVIDQVLAALDERERLIIQDYLGLAGRESKTLEDIGLALGLTRERVRQLKERALAKLRHPVHARRLRELEMNP